MSSFRFLPMWFILIALPTHSLFAQVALAKGSSPVFTINARTVVEDVVVMDKNGHHVAGLRKEDFQVFENGKAQAITFFDSNFALTEAATAPPAALPPDTFTNVPVTSPDNVTNVLLLDSMNTRSTELMYAQVQMVKYLASLPPNLRIGVFILTDKLHMIWGFNQDSSALRAAIARFSSKQSPASLLSVAAQKQAMIATVAEVQQKAKDANDARLGESADALQDFLKKGTHWFDLDPHDHAVYTMDTLQILAHYLAGIPGRKNLFWLVGSFPLCNGCATTDVFNKTKNMLGEAEVSVYPIDAHGVDSDMGIGPGAFYHQVSTRLIDSNGWAEETGGKAYHENNINQEIADAAEHGSRYYTLAYIPSDHKEEGRERKVEVKVVSGDYKLFYRKSYFEQTQREITKASAAPAKSPLLELMGRGMPNFS